MTGHSCGWFCRWSRGWRGQLLALSPGIAGSLVMLAALLAL